MKFYVINVSPNSKASYRGVISSDQRFEFVPSPVEDYEMYYKNLEVQFPQGETISFPSYKSLTSYYNPSEKIIDQFPFISKDLGDIPIRINPYLQPDGIAYTVDKGSIRAFILIHEVEPGDLLVFYSSLSHLSKTAYASSNAYFIGYLQVGTQHEFEMDSANDVTTFISKKPHFKTCSSVVESLVVQQNPKIREEREIQMREKNKENLVNPIWVIYEGTPLSQRFDHAVEINPESVEFMYEGGTYNSGKDYFERDGKAVVNKKGKINYFRHFHAKTMAIQHYMIVDHKDSSEYEVMNKFWNLIQQKNPDVPALHVIYQEALRLKK